MHYGKYREISYEIMVFLGDRTHRKAKHMQRKQENSHAYPANRPPSEQ